MTDHYISSKVNIDSRRGARRISRRAKNRPREWARPVQNLLETALHLGDQFITKQITNIALTGVQHI